MSLKPMSLSCAKHLCAEHNIHGIRRTIVPSSRNPSDRLLQLCLARLLLVSLNGLEKAQPTVLDCLDILVLFVARILVRLLKPLNECLEVCFRLLDRRLVLLDLLLALRSTQCHELVNRLLLFI